MIRPAQPFPLPGMPAWVLVSALVLLLISPLASADSLECRRWLEQQRARLDAANIHDAGSVAVDGHPHLRVDRWLAFLHGEVRTPAAEQVWLNLAAAVGLRTWQAELRRLYGGGGDWQDRLAFCNHTMTRHTSFYGVPAPSVPDSYATWQRVLGVYPLARIAAAPSMRRYQRDMSDRFHRPVRLPLHHYLPEPFKGNVPTPRDLAPNALDLPIPRGATREAMLAHYAPVLSIADPKEVNRPGTVYLNGGVPGIDSEHAVAYQWISWTRYRGHNLLQLNYQFWFSRRPAKGRFDIYAGELDGVIWRITLKPDGNVLYYDSIHSCGCYHKVFPVARGLYPAPASGDRPIYYPELAPDAARERISLLLEPDTHYLVRVTAFRPEGKLHRYQSVDADQLRQLDDRLGGIGSLYDPRGLVPASRRPERLLLWPLGVPSAGAMRQPGQHAIAFVGRRHFDDPRLPDALFRQ
jgi:hypothetical protein